MAKAFADGTFQTEYGRVREGTQLNVSTKKFASQSMAIAELNKKRQEKLKKGYQETETIDEGTVVVAAPVDLKTVAVAQIAGASDPTTRDLVEYLSTVNIHNIVSATSITYSAGAGFRTPLGALKPDAVVQARQLLQFLAAGSGDRDQLVTEYYRLVPHDFGTKIPPLSQLLATTADIQQEESILDALAAVLSTGSTEVGKVFECQLHKVPASTEEGRRTFRRIKRLYESTLNQGHVSSRLKPVRVYEVDIPSMREAFERKSAQIGNVREDLWHGTKASNLLSILKSGLFVPPKSATQVTGRMFGDGLYFSLQSTKSLNYATNFWNSSGAAQQRTFMFLCQVALGKSHKPRSSNESFPHRGTDSTWVEAGTASVMNHECVVYEVAQVNLKYLVEFQ